MLSAAAGSTGLTRRRGQGLVLEQAEGKGGRKDAQGLPCWRAMGRRTAACFCPTCGFMFGPKEALLAMGSRARTRQLLTPPACPPGFCFH